MPITTTPSGGPQGEFSTYTPIYSQTLTSTATSITFSDIPTTFTDLVLAISIIPSGAGLSPQIRVNGDSGSNYSYTTLYGNGTSALSARGSGNNTTYLYYANSPTSGTTAQYNVQFQNYSNATTFKTMLHKLSVTGIESTLQCVLWRNTSPITSIQIFTSASSFASGSTFTIYGIKAATPALKAIGGDVTTDGTYWYHTFRSTGLFETKQALTCDYLVIAGGGAGGNNKGGGGGAGGLVYVTSQSLATSTTYPVTVGAGGTAGTSGTDSVFRSTTAVGGGWGGTYTGNDSPRRNGGNGGSGGGGSSGDYNPGGSGGTATAGQGNNGGTGRYSTGGANNNNAGGGGGAGAAGANGVQGQSGAGGAGVNTYSAIAYATGSGASGYFAGGGGGGSWGNAPGAGGAGGGGAGSDGSSPTAGTISTGSGGGGVGQANASGGSGGSGIVIVRYAV